MILLFEIARRLAKAKKPSQQNDAFANLPIGRAIVRLINLLETGNYAFEDVFFEGRPFDCFSGKSWNVRRKAIEEINKATEKINKAIAEINKATAEINKATAAEINKATAEINKATAKTETGTEPEHLLKELQELFCSDQRLKEISSQTEEDQLAQTSTGFDDMSLNEALSEAEIYTAFDFVL